MATNGNPNVGATGAVSTNSDAPQPKAGGKPKNPQEVGWQFVPQYYTFLFNEPQRLHCFYNKRSTFIHGVEGEESKPCFGQQEINDKIESLNFNDCKTFISSIDAQGSADGGIIIQSIGEMSNNSGPWRKFTQTFFLAEQPNGYFVLNDIFKYLKEEGDDEDDEEVDEVEAVEDPAQVGGEEEVAVSQETSEERVQDSAVLVDAPLQAEQAAPAPAEDVKFTEASGANVEVSEAGEEEATTAEEIPEDKEAEEVQTSAEPPAVEEVEEADEPVTETASQHTPAPAAAPAPSPTPASAAPKQAEKLSPAPAPAQVAPAQPPKPSGPKTWASLAATGKGAWGSSLASKEGTSSAPAPTPAPAATPTSAAPAQKAAPQAQAAPAQQQLQPQQQQQQQQGNQKGGNMQGGRFSARLEAAKNVQTPICFVKLSNWQSQDGAEAVDENTLGAVLSRFGEIAKVEIVKNKACAFVEFKSVDSARKAIIMSLNPNDGGEGGVRTPDGAKILVESRKEKEERGKGPAPGGREQGNRRGPPSGSAGGPPQQGGNRPPQQPQAQQQQQVAPATGANAVDDQGFIPAGKPPRTQQGGNRGGKGPRGGKAGGGADRSQAQQGQK